MFIWINTSVVVIITDWDKLNKKKAHLKSNHRWLNSNLAEIKKLNAIYSILQRFKPSWH